MTRILIVEDNSSIAHGVRAALLRDGVDIRLSADGLDGLERIRMWIPDVVILDLMLPRLDGLDVLRTMREEGFDMPVLILSARGDDVDKVRGFRTGADDYVTKPFSLAELEARIDALTRRRGSSRGVQPQSAKLRIGALEISASTREVRHQNQLIELRPREFDLLLALMRRQGAAVTRRELLREVWGYDDDVESRTIDSHIVEIRRRLKAGGVEAVQILTTRKVGYRMVDGMNQGESQFGAANDAE